MAALRSTPAELAALSVPVLATAGFALGGVWLRSQAGPSRQLWLDALKTANAERPWVRVPASVDEDRLLGGLDLGATLTSGRPVMQTGLLAAAHEGMLELRMAERQSAAVMSSISQVCDSGQLQVERDGFSESFDARCTVIACDEAIGDDEPMDPRVADRLGVVCDLDYVPANAIGAAETPVPIAQAATLWRAVVLDDAHLHELQRIADALSLNSPRPVLAALAAAKALAALHERDVVDDQDVIDAAALCLIARVPGALEQLQNPPEPPAEEAEAAPPPETSEAKDMTGGDEQSADARPDDVSAAADAILPDQLLATLAAQQMQTARQRAGGNAASAAEGSARGKPLPSRAGAPVGGRRLDVLATLKTAAPWQRVRGGQPGRLRVQKSDLRIRRFTEQSRTTTIFVVDASGSAAVQRLGETKGAIELLLAECYVRRDQVALIAFRGETAELLLPPTRSLVRAKRALAALPGGGGTPLATGIRLATQVADGIHKRGETPVIVLLSDGRGNVTLEGAPDPALATEQALAVAGELAARQYLALAIDTGRRASQRGRRLAEAMQARYLALPFAGATEVVDAVQREVAA